MSPLSESRAAEVLLSLATLATATPDIDQIAAMLGRPAREVAEELLRLERSDLVETWPDPCSFGSRRVILTSRTAARLGLRLSPRGDRWETTGNPDRPRPRRGGR